MIRIFLLCEMDTECEIMYNLLIASSIKKKSYIGDGECRVLQRLHSSTSLELL